MLIPIIYKTVRFISLLDLYIILWAPDSHYPRFARMFLWFPPLVQIIVRFWGSIGNTSIRHRPSFWNLFTSIYESTICRLTNWLCFLIVRFVHSVRTFWTGSPWCWIDTLTQVQSIKRQKRRGPPHRKRCGTPRRPISTFPLIHQPEGGLTPL
jgi:hypothetical protein